MGYKNILSFQTNFCFTKIGDFSKTKLKDYFS